MNPLTFGLLSAFFISLKDGFGKALTNKYDEFVVASTIYGIAAILLTPVLLFAGIPTIGASFWIGAIGSGITAPLGSLLYLRAIRIAPLSSALPFLALNPIITALLSIGFDKRFPSLIGWFGILLIATGMYTGSVIGGRSWRKNLHSLLTEPALLPMLGVSFAWAFGAHFWKLLVSGSSIIFAVTFSSWLTFIVVFCLIGKGRLAKFKIPSSNFLAFIAMSISNLLSDLFLYMALSVGYTPYVVPLKRTNMIWSSLIGKYWFQENVPKQKVFGILLEIGGIFALALS